MTTPGTHTSGWCEHWPKAGLSPLEQATDKVTIYLAGEAAALIVPTSGFIESVDGCFERAEQTAQAALDWLPPAEASFVGFVQADSQSTPTDMEGAEAIAAEAAGDEFYLFMAFCAARARRLVAANLPLFLEVLLPLGLSSPILTGADVEQAIEAARSGPERS